MLVLLVALSLLATIAEAQRTPIKAHEPIRVVQKDGVWWFQDGSGRQFFSSGVNCVGGWYGHAVDGSVSEWPKELAIKPTRIIALADEVKVDHTYLHGL